MKPGEPFNPRKMFVGIFIPDALLACQDLSLGAKLLWAVLARMAGENGHCWPTQELLSKACGCSVREIQRRLKELCAYGLIRSERQNRTKSSRYIFLWHEIFARRGDNLSPATRPNGRVRGDQMVVSEATKRSCRDSCQLTDTQALKPEILTGKEKKKREKKREKQASGAPPARPQPAMAGLLASDLAVEVIGEALRPHAEAIGQQITPELIQAIEQASQGRPLAAASLIGKIIHRRFSDRALPGYRQPWPDSLNYWVRVVREELHGLA